MKRRSFIRTIGGAAGACALGVPDLFAEALEEEKVNGMPRRALGRTGLKISVVGFPGLALNHYPQEECTKGLHRVFEQGMNYFDVAPAYGNGVCETRMGIGLQGIDRSKYFLACKTNKRDKEGAQKELENSLTQLKTDHFDLYQLHHLREPAEVRKALGPGGAMEAILKAREQGKIKYIGFSAHTTKAALLAMKEFQFDTIMFPINFVEYYTIGFGKEVLETAREKGMGVLAIKALSRGQWPEGAERTRKWWYRATEEMEEVHMAIRWSLSQPNVASTFTPSFLDLVDKAIEAAKAVRPITQEERDKLREIAGKCRSVFKSEEDRVVNLTMAPAYYDCPHQHHGGHLA